MSSFHKIINIVNAALLTASCHTGLGRHIATLSPEMAMRAIKIHSMAVPFGIMSVGVPKISIVCLLMRVKPSGRKQTILLYFLAISLNVLSAICVIIFFTQCAPVNTLWNPKIPHKCLPESIFFDIGIIYSGRNCQL